MPHARDAIARRSHLADALRWSTEPRVEPVELLAAGLGMAGPVILGAASGHLALGLAASVGGLMVAGAGMGPSAKAHARELTAVLAPAAAASLAVTLATGHGWLTDAALVMLAFAAATVSGYSRPLARAAMRFVLFLTLTVNLADATTRPSGVLAVVMASAIGAAMLSLVLGGVVRAHRRGARPSSDRAAQSTGTSAATASRRYTRWRRSLTRLAGWQYPLRLGACLSIAAIVRWRWPDHHLHWIALIVAILTQRQRDALPIKTTQRALGTVLGVAAAALFAVLRPPVWGLVLGIGILAGARPLLKARNYLAYSAVMTLLVMLIMGADQPLGADILIDRLLATFLGAGLVTLASVLAAAWLTEPPDAG